MYRVKGVSAGIQVFSEDVEAADIPRFLENKNVQLKNGELSISFGSVVTQTVNEVCIDVHEIVLEYRPGLSTAFKC